MRPFLCLTSAAALAVAQLAAQSITITSAPPYGSAGSIAGTVTGVNFATHRVAAYIYIDGAGWWSKPSAANPTVPINPNGTFSASVYTCCLDDRATLFCAALVPAASTPPLASGFCAIPSTLQSLAEDHFDRPGRTIQFAGRTWSVKESPEPVGPGGNRFSDHPSDVFLDSIGRLHLRVAFRDGHWRSSEVVLLDDVGYGTYWFTTESQVGSLDPNVTFGAFTWDAHCDDTTIPEWPNREIDFEDSRWGNAGDPNSSQVVVQPWTISGNMLRYFTPTLAPSPRLTRFFTWAPDRIEFGAVPGLASPGTFSASTALHSSTYLHNPAIGHRIPPAGREKFRFNLWINQGGAPSNGQVAEVIISDFRFAPTAGTFPGGCGINPEGSGTLVAGAPNLGNSVTLGFDNPAGTQNPGSLAGMLLGGPASRFPCGLLQLGMGMTGPVGELLVDPSSQPIGVLGGLWAGPGQPTTFSIAIPNLSTLTGLCIYAQGALLDPIGPVPIGLADGFELCIQP
ncbi:MAG: hypothetical protein VYE77_01155 [Planctomycetota bacterium]|nr:hypothetical protein [Planctomycetota bacterium]